MHLFSTYLTLSCAYNVSIAISIVSLQIDDSASESFLGVIVAGYSLGAVLVAPLFGVWSNYRPVPEPLIFSLILYCGGNLLYVYAESFSGIEKWILFISRLMVGSGSGYHKVLLTGVQEVCTNFYSKHCCSAFILLRSYLGE